MLLQSTGQPLTAADPRLLDKLGGVLRYGESEPARVRRPLQRAALSARTRSRHRRCESPRFLAVRIRQLIEFVVRYEQGDPDRAAIVTRRNASVVTNRARDCAELLTHVAATLRVYRMSERMSMLPSRLGTHRLR